MVRLIMVNTTTLYATFAGRLLLSVKQQADLAYIRIYDKSKNNKLVWDYAEPTLEQAQYTAVLAATSYLDNRF